MRGKPVDLVGVEDVVRLEKTDRAVLLLASDPVRVGLADLRIIHAQRRGFALADLTAEFLGCLLYTSDAADERSSVDLGGSRIIKKTKKANSAHCDRIRLKHNQ